ncbi:MAG: mercury resistance system periplasmic binding protein MerP [Vicinamibacterales bacterium]|nr:mercury resistance system periplasmic binding protein MerP [Vicinamibacterales bacterium]
MKMLLATAATLLLLASPAWAGTKTVTLDVSGMTCATCPIVVKKALTSVDGVTEVQVSFEERQATVTFDEARTTVEALTKATTNAGFPSTVKK